MLLVIVVEATVILPEVLPETLNTPLFSIRAMTYVLEFLTPTNHVIISPTLIGINLAMTNIIKHPHT